MRGRLKWEVYVTPTTKTSTLPLCESVAVDPLQYTAEHHNDRVAVNTKTWPSSCCSSSSSSSPLTGRVIGQTQTTHNVQPFLLEIFNVFSLKWSERGCSVVRFGWHEANHYISTNSTRIYPENNQNNKYIHSTSSSPSPWSVVGCCHVNQLRIWRDSSRYPTNSYFGLEVFIIWKILLGNRQRVHTYEYRIMRTLEKVIGSTTHSDVYS